MFSILTEEDAYWFGFLTADGSLGRSGKLSDGSPYFSGVVCQLARKDEGHLLKMKDWFLSKGYKVSVKRMKSGKYDASRLCVNSVSLSKDFITLGWSGNKTSNLLRPYLSPNLLSSYYRGLFDGDGSVQIRTRGYMITAQLLGAKTLLEQISCDYNLFFSIPLKLYELSPKSAGVGRLVLAGNKANQFLTWLYVSSNIHLDRKYTVWATYNETRKLLTL